MADHVIQVGTAVFNFTPYAMARSASHFFKMAEAYQADGSAYLPRLHLFGVAMEVGLKSSILLDSNTHKAKEYIQYEIGHDLIKARATFEKIYDARIFSDEDVSTLLTMSDHYRRRAFQFFTPPMLMAVMSGYRNLPPIGAVESCASKVIAFLEEHDFFLQGDPIPEGRGRNPSWVKLA